MSSEINEKTKISLHLVIIIIGAALAIGAVFQRINSIDIRVTRIEQKLDTVLQFRSLTFKQGTQ